MNSRRGGTLVEVMMACVVLSVIALAGGAYIYHSMETLALQRDRAVALAMANSRMEELRGTAFAQLTNLVASQTSGTNVVWIKPGGGSWVVTSSSDYDPLIIGSRTEQLRTGLQNINLIAGSGQYEGLIFTVKATCRPPGEVVLQTICSP